MFVWRLYYEDGTTFSDTDGEPYESPVWGCVALAQPHLDGSDKIMVNADYYLWRPDRGEWYQCGVDGLDDHMAHFGHLIQCVRKTRWIPSITFNDVWATARRDCGLKE